MIQDFLQEVKDAIDKIEINELNEMIAVLENVRENKGRLFLIGSGGGAGHASHACADFRKLCGIEAYAPYDNVSELTARTNDEGWDTTIVEYLKVSRFSAGDCLFVFSVGGGTPSV
jgi:D-sedoheptulose 7-phosphate isomerase